MRKLRITVATLGVIMISLSAPLVGAVGESCADSSMLSFNWGPACATTGDLIALVFKVLAGMVGVAVVGGIAWGGMLYTTSNGNASKAQQGVTAIVNSVIGLLLFIFMFAITNFIVPGGILK